MATLNLDIFKQEGNDCNWNKDDPIKSCLPLHRLVAALSYYSRLKRDDLTDTFGNFINEVYNKQLLEDYAHLLDEHNDDLHAINEYLVKFENVCSIKKCLFSLRHHRCAQVTDEHKIKESKFKFYAETMDSLHFHFYHLFECGMRTTTNDFAQMVKITNDKRKSTQMFDRFAVGNKFNLTNDQTNDSKTTFLDEAVVKVKSKVFERFLLEEAFDSDGIEMDIECNANIAETLNDKSMECLQELIKNVKRQRNTFSIGLRFYYWPYYEKREDYDDVHVDIKICDLYIKKKFNDFKAEIFAYDNISKEQNDRTMAKALELEKTKKVKSTTTKYYFDDYGIAENSVISLWHLIAIILYTDFSAHCSQFSASFRSLTPFETSDVTKSRNANYYWMSRYLREAVEVFGKNRDGGRYNIKQGMYGPFYCGINRRMVIPEFNLRLNAPTSTTKQIEVALKFAGSDGTILQMNNDSNASGHFQFFVAIVD